MPTARRDYYEWDCVLSAIELIRDDVDNDFGLRRIDAEVLASIESKVQVALDTHPHEGEWKRIPVELSTRERTFVNRRLAPLTMVHVSYQLDRLDLLGLHAVEEEYEILQDRILYITTVSPKYGSDMLSLWVAHDDYEWLDSWLCGCTTLDGTLR